MPGIIAIVVLSALIATPPLLERGPAWFKPFVVVIFLIALAVAAVAVARTVYARLRSLFYRPKR